MSCGAPKRDRFRVWPDNCSLANIAACGFYRRRMSDDSYPPRSAGHYRRMAAQLREMAASEAAGSEIVGQLLGLAAQYDRLAEQVQESRGAE